MPFQCSVDGDIFVIRATGVVKMEDVDLFGAEQERYLTTPGCKGLCITDTSELKVIAPDAADALTLRMKATADRIVRSAVVVGEGTGALQVSRLIRDAGSDKRRTFTSVEHALAWLKS